MIRTKAENRAQLEALQQLHLTSDYRRIDFWQAPKGIGGAVDVMVGPNEILSLKAFFQQLGLNHSIIISDVQNLTETRNAKSYLRKLQSRRRRASTPFYDFQRYQDLEEMDEYLRDIARDYPHIAQLETIGHSHENRPIKVLRIGNGDGSWGKKGIWIDGGMHAREWAAPHVAVYFIHKVSALFHSSHPSYYSWPWLFLVSW